MNVAKSKYFGEGGEPAKLPMQLTGLMLQLLPLTLMLFMTLKLICTHVDNERMYN
jgi:hypothetical protein